MKGLNDALYQWNNTTPHWANQRPNCPKQPEDQRQQKNKPTAQKQTTRQEPPGTD